MREFLKATLVLPLYHLWIAGPARQCSRLSFFLGILHLCAFGIISSYAIMFFNKVFFNSTGFPYASQGQTYCHWTLLKAIETNPFKQLVIDYSHLNKGSIDAYMWSLYLGSCLLGLILTWRVLMLVIQRANNTRLSATWAVSITVALFSLNYLISDGGLSYLNGAFVAWIVLLALIPPSVAVAAPTNDDKLGRWLTQPWYYAFASPYSVVISGRNFLLAFILAVLMPIAAIVIWTQVMELQNLLPAYYPEMSVDQIICNWALLSYANENIYYRLVSSTYFRVVYSPINNFTVAAGLATIAGLFYTHYRATYLFSQRLRALGVQYPVACGVLLVVLYLGGCFTLKNTAYSSLPEWAFAVFIIILALLKPRREVS